MTTTKNIYDSHGNLTHILIYDDISRRYNVIVEGVNVGWYDERDNITVSMRNGLLGHGNLIPLLVAERPWD